MTVVMADLATTSCVYRLNACVLPVHVAFAVLCDWP